MNYSRERTYSQDILGAVGAVVQFKGDDDEDYNIIEEARHPYQPRMTSGIAMLPTKRPASVVVTLGSCRLLLDYYRGCSGWRCYDTILTPTSS